MAGDDDPLEALLAGIRSKEADLAADGARRRSQRRWRQQLAVESSTMSGVLRTLAERRERVTLRAGRWTHHGCLRWVSQSIAALDEDGELTLVATSALAVVEAATPIADDRPCPAHPDMAEALADMVPGRPAVCLQLGDGTEHTGTLLDVGQDIVRLRLPASIATVRLGAIAVCVFLERSLRPVPATPSAV